jgi:hypothetical protein
MDWPEFSWGAAKSAVACLAAGAAIAYCKDAIGKSLFNYLMGTETLDDANRDVALMMSAYRRKRHREVKRYRRYTPIEPVGFEDDVKWLAGRLLGIGRGRQKDPYDL